MHYCTFNRNPLDLRRDLKFLQDPSEIQFVLQEKTTKNKGTSKEKLVTRVEQQIVSLDRITIIFLE